VGPGGIAGKGQGRQMDQEAEARRVLDLPEMAPYARHVFICSGPFCDPEGEGKRLYALLAQKLGELGLYDNPLRVKRGITPCLGVCHSGPVLVVYPDGIWYCQVDETLLDRIVEEHLRGGRPVEEAVYHRLDLDATNYSNEVR